MRTRTKLRAKRMSNKPPIKNATIKNYLLEIKEKKNEPRAEV